MAAAPSLLKPKRLMTARSRGQAEQARARVAGLRPRRGGADLDEAEAGAAEGGDGAGVLVEAGGEAERVRQVEAGEAGGEARRW